MLKFFNANLSLDSLKILSKNKKFSILSQTYQTVFEWTSFLHRGGSHDRKMFSAQKKKKIIFCVNSSQRKIKSAGI